MSAARAAALAAAALVLTAAASAAAAARPLELRDLRRVATIADPQISPDGTRVAYVLRRADFAKDRNRSELVVLDLRTHARVTFTHERDDVSSPRWSPQGDRLAYLATPLAEDERATPAPGAPARRMPQLHVAPAGGGDPLVVTAAKNAVEAFAWSPDGRRLAFVTRDEAPNRAALEAHEDAFDVVGDAWNGRSAPTPSHLWLVGAGGTRAHRLTSGAWSVAGAPFWSPDGTHLVFTRYADPYPGHTLPFVAVADARTGETNVLFEGEAAAVVRAGGRIVARVPNPRARTQSDLAVADAAGGHRSDALRALDRNVRGVVASERGVVVAVADGTRRRLFRVAFDGAVARYPAWNVSVNGSPSMARDGTLAFAGATATDPSELYVLRPAAAQPERLSGYNGFLGAFALGHTRSMAWRGADGTLVDGVVTEPPGMTRTRRYPLVLVIHGGPTGASTEAFGELAALMAARGWIVFQPNYRGSDNHGSRSMQTAIPHVASVGGADILRGVAELERQDPVDAHRIGVSGWSAGGLMTSWLIAHDTRWRAAMSGAAVNDLAKVGDMSDADEYAWTLAGGAHPYESAAAQALYAQESPLSYAENVRTPLLIMTDAGDQRVPTPSSYEFYHAVRATGTPVEMVVFPVNGHFPADPVRSEDVNRRWIEWFARSF